MADALIVLCGFDGETQLIDTAKHIRSYHGYFGQSDSLLDVARAALRAIVLAQHYLPVDRPGILPSSLNEPTFADILRGADSVEE